MTESFGKKEPWLTIEQTLSRTRNRLPNDKLGKLGVPNFEDQDKTCVALLRKWLSFAQTSKSERELSDSV